MTTTASRRPRRAIIVEVDDLAALPIYERMQILKQRLLWELALQSLEARPKIFRVSMTSVTNNSLFNEE